MSIEIPSGAAAYSDHNPPPKNRQVLLFLGLFLGTIILIVWVAGWLASGLVWLIPNSVEQQLGKAVVPIYEAQAEPSVAQDTLNDLLNRIETELPAQQRSDRDYQVLYIPEPVVNAAAIPGDRVLIYQGLLDEMGSENELMMVLGHELGHFANRDHLRGLSRQIMVRLVLAAFLGDIGSIGAIATSSTSMIANAQFSQQQEYQADEVGLQLLTKTYGHAAGATDFFETLMGQQSLNLEILSSHPTSEKRVKRLESLIQKGGYQIGERSPLPRTLE
ncbi:MAG: M48 family metallopeptidase, partial [Merismopedia sp. SIO2A8]|nr:M48 family metallopeptidase [Merismopedia sp. SIO2A8]